MTISGTPFVNSPIRYMAASSLARSGSSLRSFKTAGMQGSKFRLDSNRLRSSGLDAVEATDAPTPKVNANCLPA